MRIDKKRKPRISPWLAPTFRGQGEEEKIVQVIKIEGIEAKPGQCGILETK